MGRGLGVKQTPRVLIIDDDPGIRDLISLALSDEGYEVVSATNGQDALALIETSPPAVILLDTRMPVMNGQEFIRVYRTRPGPHAPVIVLSAASDADEIARDVSADDVLTKPFDLMDLIDTVAHHTSRDS